MHADTRPECGLNVVVNDEAGLAIESPSVLVGGDLDSIRSAAARDGSNVTHQCPASSTPHLVRIDEQVLKLNGVRSGYPRSEADDGACANCGSDAPLCHRNGRKLQDLGMGEQLRPVAIVRQRRPAKHVTQCCHVSWHRVADPECRHEVSIPGVGGLRQSVDLGD